MIKKNKCVIINTYFENEDLTDSSIIPENNQYIKRTCELIKTHSQDLKIGGLLFVYSAPKYVPYFCTFLDKLVCSGEKNESRFLFKYNICLEFKESNIFYALRNSNLMIAMYLKTKSLEHPTKFNLNTKNNRVAYRVCKSCNQNVVDWGGKKHLMNPLGSALSDVWSDLDWDSKNIGKMPTAAIKRISQLMKIKPKEVKIVKQGKIERNI